MAFGLDDLLLAVAVPVVSSWLAPKPKIPRDPLSDRLMYEQLSQLQAMRNLAPLLAAQQTLSGIANARAAMENLLREAAARQGAMGLVSSSAVNEARGRALSGFGEAVAQLRQQQPMLTMQLLQGAQEPLAALQQLSAQRQALAAQEAEMQQAAQEAWGQVLGAVLPYIMQQRPKPPATAPAPAPKGPWGSMAQKYVMPWVSPTATWEDRMKSLRW